VFQLRVAVLPDIIAVFVAEKVSVGTQDTHHPRSESDEHRGVPLASNPVITPLPLQLFPMPVAGSPNIFLKYVIIVPPVASPAGAVGQAIVAPTLATAKVSPLTRSAHIPIIASNRDRSDLASFLGRNA